MAYNAPPVILFAATSRLFAATSRLFAATSRLMLF
jgi:hypothetical protein